MKKKFLLLMVLLLCIGCTRINNNNYDVIVNDVIENSNNIYNTNSLGYKYYLPFSINKVYDKDSSDSYYYYKINNNKNKNGYVKITKDKDKYFMKVVYNYAKIETYVEEYELADILSYSMIILNSINYNDNLIEKILQDDYYSSSFKEYKIKKPEDAESKFSEYLSEYVGEEDSIIPDLPEY